MLRVDGTSAALAAELAADDNWLLTHLLGMHAVFVHKDHALAPRVKPFAVTAGAFDASDYIRRLRGLDPVPAHALHVGGVTLQRISGAARLQADPRPPTGETVRRTVQWLSAAIAVLKASLAEDDGSLYAWFELGASWALRGATRLRIGDINARKDFLEARDCFRRCLDIQPDFEPARRNLRTVEIDLSSPR